MDKRYYTEMLEHLEMLEREEILRGKEIYLFGHCNATEQLAEVLRYRNYEVGGILDNNPSKQGTFFNGIPIIPPEAILSSDMLNTIVCIVARACAAMTRQLRQIGYRGRVERLVDYNSFSEYSLSEKTIAERKRRLDRGICRLKNLEEKYPGAFRIYCPFSALGDMFFTMSYLPYFLTERKIANYVICVADKTCKQVVDLFDGYRVEVCGQRELDEIIQASLYLGGTGFFIAHQDRPYVIHLHKALYNKCIPLELIYKCGIFGLSHETKAYRPVAWRDFPDLDIIQKGKAVVLSPYAKSVPVLDGKIWQSIVANYQKLGYQCLTNVVGDEQPLEGTLGISPSIAQLQSVVEYAGTFIGIRSGLCDVVRYARCRKIALYPDYCYSDTKWKAIDMYAIDGWENIVADEEFRWNAN